MANQDSDPPDSSEIVVGVRIEVYWPMDTKFYSGAISSSNCSSGKHEVTYDEGDIEIFDFSKERWNHLKNQVVFCHAVLLMRKAMRKHHIPSSVNIVIADDPLDNRFKESSKDEIKGLLDRGSYEVMQKSDILVGATILKSRIQNSFKTDQSGKVKYKTRLIIQGHRDPEKGTIVTEAPTILRN